MDKWEYKIALIFGSDKAREAKLNEFGQQGWELVCIGGRVFYFKRRISS